MPADHSPFSVNDTAEVRFPHARGLAIQADGRVLVMGDQLAGGLYFITGRDPRNPDHIFKLAGQAHTFEDHVTVYIEIDSSTYAAERKAQERPDGD